MATAVVLGSVKNNLTRGSLLKLLAFLASAEVIKAGFAFIPEKKATQLITADASLAIRRTDVPNDASGNVAVALTPAGISAAASVAASTPAAPSTPEPKQEFVIEENVPLPVSKRGGGAGASIYPFDKLLVNQSFHVAPTEKRPNPAKALASTVSSATRRYKSLPEAEQRKFTIRAVGATDPKGAGARIFRTK